MANSILRLLVAVSGVALAISSATLATGARAQQLPPGVTAAECDQLAGIPNAPISVETCRAMFGMAASMEAAANDPRARRPGDEALSCAQLFDELKAVAEVGLSKATTGQLAAVVGEGQAAAAKGVADGTAFMAETVAVGVAMAAMGPYVPNFVGTAIVAAWQARAVALGARMQAEQAQRNTRMSPAFTAAATELAQMLQANPRVAWLGQLAIAKNCQPPSIESK